MPGVGIRTAFSGIVMPPRGIVTPSNFSAVLNGTSQYFTATGKTAINQQKFTWAAWFKSTTTPSQRIFYFGDGTTNNFVLAGLNTNGTLVFTGVTAGSTVFSLQTTTTYADGNWHHVVYAMDTTQATANNRGIIWIDGAQATLTTNTQPAQNTNLSINFAATYDIGVRISNFYWNGKLAQLYNIDGQQLTPTSFITGTPGAPKAYSGTYTGVFDFFLPFSNAAALGADGSGEGNNWTPQNSPTQSSDYP